MQHDAPHESPSTLTIHADDDEIDLRPILNRIWAMRKFVLTGVLFIIAIAVIANELLAQYQSEAHLKLNNISSTDYKLYQPAIFNADRVKSYAAEMGAKDGETLVFVARLVSLRPEVLEQYASIVRSIPPKGSTLFIGMDLKIPGPNPEVAQSRSQLLGEYLIDSLIYADLQSWLDSAAQAGESAAYTDKINGLKAKRTIDDAGKLIEGLQLLNKRFPSPARIEVRVELADRKNIVKDDSIGDEGSQRRDPQERVMPPSMQIVATESLILDERIVLSALLRKQRQSDLAYDYYKQAAAIRATTNSGRELLKKLTLLKDGFKRDISASDAAGIEVMSEISHELDQRQLGYESGFKFLSGPTLPQGKTRKNPLLIAFVAGGAGMFVMAILALLISWWRQKREPRTEGGDTTLAAA